MLNFSSWLTNLLRVLKGECTACHICYMLDNFILSLCFTSINPLICFIVCYFNWFLVFGHGCNMKITFWLPAWCLILEKFLFRNITLFLLLVIYLINLSKICLIPSMWRQRSNMQLKGYVSYIFKTDIWSFHFQWLIH